MRAFVTLQANARISQLEEEKENLLFGANKSGKDWELKYVSLHTIL